VDVSHQQQRGVVITGVCFLQVAIFGFCDIRNFTDLTEVLQEGVMSFVNTIAQIVHSEVHLHNGAANKNIGDAFLLVWKFRQGFTCVTNLLVSYHCDHVNSRKVLAPGTSWLGLVLRHIAAHMRRYRAHMGWY
jgi:class 3 adenylate cyclase